MTAAKRAGARYLKVSGNRPVTVRLVEETTSTGADTGRVDWELTYFVTGIRTPAMDNGLVPRAVVLYLAANRTRQLPLLQTYC